MSELLISMQREIEALKRQMQDYQADQYVTGIAWTAYTPTWTASTTNPTLGDGSLTGIYKIHSRVCFYSAKIVVGSTTNTGSGTWYLSLPFEADGTYYSLFAGSAFGNNAGVLNYVFSVKIATSTTVEFVIDSGAYVGNAAPFAWGNADNLSMSIVYMI